MIRELGSRVSALGGRLAHPVIAVGLGLVALQAVVRAWALYPSWFYTDDYRLLYDATAADLSWGYLLEPFDSQFMPFGRFVAWVVAESGHLNWTLAATITLLLQVLASLAFLWMLVTLFGPRWGILAPLALHLTSALTVPALMWWAASLNQIPLQIVLPCAVATWVRYLRTRSPRWLATCLAAVALGLLAYVKTVFIVPLLAYILLAYFCTGGPIQRVRSAFRRFWPAALAFTVLAGAYTAYYVLRVPSVIDDDRDLPVAGLAQDMLGRSLISGAAGGPVRWELFNPPVAMADPPVALVALAWIVVAGVIAHLWLTRERTGRVWVMVAAYATGAYLVLLTSRAGTIGALAGSELRYLTDVLPVAALGLGLAAMPLLGAPDATAPRTSPLLTRPLGPRTAVVTTVVVALLGLLSTVRYVDGWHHDNPGAAYFANATSDLEKLDEPTLAEQTAPGNVVPGMFHPYNSTERLLPLATSVSFPDATDHLLVLDPWGKVRTAVIGAGPRAVPGQTPDCGWAVQAGSGQSIPLTESTIDWEWWVRIGYLSATTTPATIRAGDSVVSTQFERGLNNLYVRVEGKIDQITIDGLTDDAVVCVDSVEVGEPTPGGTS